MSHFIDSLVNRKHLQQALAAAKKIGGSPYYAGDIDGILGGKSALAISLYRKDHDLSEAAVIDNALLRSLNLTPETIVQLPQIGATVADYFLNFITSKIAWAAAAMVAVAVAWINTRFGYNVPPEVQNTVTALIVSGFGALIMLLRTFANAPKVVSKMPETITAKGAMKL